jgi:acetyl esterase/lipase
VLVGALAVVRGWSAEPAANLEAVEVQRDVSYAEGGNPRQTMDLYLPKERVSQQRLPVVVFIHGGGWQNGSKSAGKSWVQPYAASGHYVGVSVGYRLAGEATWPAQIQDCKAAVRWLRANASRYGLDPDRIGVVGNSAGATLALLLGASQGVPELEGTVGPHATESSRVAAIVNFFGRINFLAEPESARAGPAQAAALVGRLTVLFGGTLGEKAELAREASPVNHITAGHAPVFTAHGTSDELVPYVQALELDAEMQRSGVPHTLIPMQGFGHGFQNAEANRRARQFFDRYLRGVVTEISTEAIVAPAKK